MVECVEKVQGNYVELIQQRDRRGRLQINYWTSSSLRLLRLTVVHLVVNKSEINKLKMNQSTYST